MVHRRPVERSNLTSQIVLLAHRGFHASGHPENTLPALLAATPVTDGVETDVRETAGGELVLNHDPDLFGLPVEATSLGGLKAHAAGRGHYLTTLAEAVDALPADRWLFLELKVGGIGQRALQIAGSKFGPRLRAGSFVPEHLEGVPEQIRWHISMAVPAGPAARGLVMPAPVFLALPDAAQLPCQEFAAWQVRTVDEGRSLLARGIRYLIVDDPLAFQGLRT